MQSKLFSTNKTLRLAGRVMDLTCPRVMGILNITPDSFYAGSRHQQQDAILRQAEVMLTEGADFLDVGGYSSRPQAEDISVAEELQRVVPAIAMVCKQFPEAIVSVDTFRSEVARQAIEVGAQMVNDISGGSLDEGMWELITKQRVPYVMMHMRGTPQQMTSLVEYEHLVRDIVLYFAQRIAQLQRSGVTDIIVDPGFGFAKTVAQNFDLLHDLDYFQTLGKPVLVGLSRKSMIWRTLQTDPENALNGTTALHAAALLKGASILRVHDVKEAVEVVKLIKFVR